MTRDPNRRDEGTIRGGADTLCDSHARPTDMACSKLAESALFGRHRLVGPTLAVVAHHADDT